MYEKRKSRDELEHKPREKEELEPQLSQVYHQWKYQTLVQVDPHCSHSDEQSKRKFNKYSNQAIITLKTRRKACRK